jgi:hypothetical protein
MAFTPINVFYLCVVLLVNMLINSAIISAEIASNKNANHSTSFTWMLAYTLVPSLLTMVAGYGSISYVVNSSQ